MFEDLSPEPEDVVCTKAPASITDDTSDTNPEGGDFIFSGFPVAGANAAGISIDTAAAIDDSVIVVTLANVIGPDDQGVVSFSGAGVTFDVVGNPNTQTANVPVTDGITALAEIVDYRTVDADVDGQIDQIQVQFSRPVNVVDGNPSDGSVGALASSHNCSVVRSFSALRDAVAAALASTHVCPASAAIPEALRLSSALSAAAAAVASASVYTRVAGAVGSGPLWSFPGLECSSSGGFVGTCGSG